MTVKELIEKLMSIPNQNAEVNVVYGCLMVNDRILIDDGDDLK